LRIEVSNAARIRAMWRLNAATSEKLNHS